MSVWALGLNHTTAPLDLRGRFAFALDQIAPTLQSLRTAVASGRHEALLSHDGGIYRALFEKQVSELAKGLVV